MKGMAVFKAGKGRKRQSCRRRSLYFPRDGGHIRKLGVHEPGDSVQEECLRKEIQKKVLGRDPRQRKSGAQSQLNEVLHHPHNILVAVGWGQPRAREHGC